MKSNVKKLLNCDICKKTGFTSRYKLKIHLFIHEAVCPRFECTYCSKKFYRKDVYRRHTACHKNQQKLHYCDHCGRAFVDKRNLINHLLLHDDLHVAAKRYKCVVCDVSYCEQRLLKYHIRKHHLNLDSTAPIHIEKKLNDSWIEPAMDSNCVQITKVKNNMLRIKKCKITTKVEVKDEHEKNALQNFMGSRFALNSSLYSKAICDYCNKEMLKKSITKHINERHLNIRKFHCYECQRSFNRHYQILEHNCGKVRRTRKNQLLLYVGENGTKQIKV